MCWRCHVTSARYLVCSAHSEPKNDGLIVNFLNNNSANFDGLGKLESLVRQIGPPKWPWRIDPPDRRGAGAARTGNLRPAAGQWRLHRMPRRSPGKLRFPCDGRPGRRRSSMSEPTPVPMTSWHGGDKKTGVLQGAFIPFATQPSGRQGPGFQHPRHRGDRLDRRTGIAGRRIAEPRCAGGDRDQHPNPERAECPDTNSQTAAPALRELQGAFHPPTSSASTSTAPNLYPNLSVQGLAIPNLIAPATPLPPKGAYEARVLQGIWATAPYLHNGSVPSLTELLKPAAQRVKQFKLGPAYDPDTVGLAVDRHNSTTPSPRRIAAIWARAAAIAATSTGPRNCRTPRRRHCWNI